MAKKEKEDEGTDEWQVTRAGDPVAPCASSMSRGLYWSFDGPMGTRLEHAYLSR